MLEHKAVISGIGQSAIGRRLNRTGLDLTIDAALAAIADAGLDRDDIDGVACWPGLMADAPGLSPVGITDLKEALGLRLNYYSGGAEGPGQLASVLNACMAVATGQARHVLCFRTLTETSGNPPGKHSSHVGGGDRVDGRWQWQVPYNAISAANWTALYAQRYFHDYGATREQLAQIALTCRRNAGLNPKAVYRTPLSMEEYLSARMISTPLCLYDCDVPVDASTAVIVSHRDTLRDLKAPAIRIEAICGPLHGRDSWDQTEDLTLAAAADAGRRLWERTDLKPKDVDVAQLYDGFAFFPLAWLEALGFCKRGEAASFVEGGRRIALDGELPLNTGGGQLSEGRLHGFGHLHEAVVQLRGIGGERQVRSAPKVAVVTAGGGPLASAALLVRE